MTGRPAALAVAVALFALAVGCSRDAPRCPGATAPDAPRAAALMALLEGTPEAADVTRRAHGRSPRVCFGEVAVSAVTTEGDVLLDRALGDAEAAARLGHLLLHVVEGSPAPPPGSADCGAAVARSLAIEARALSLELVLRRSLGVRAPHLRYAFEAPYWRAAPETREALLVAHLNAHPHGAPGLDGLAAGYLRRCREERARAAP